MSDDDGDERMLKELERNRASQRKRFWREIYAEARRRQFAYTERLLLRHIAMVRSDGLRQVEPLVPGDQ